MTTDGKTFKKPRRPYEKERLDAELKLVGEYGLRNKRELWRVQMVLSKIRNAARVLLTLDEKDPKRIFEGNALMRRMNRYGLLNESQDKLDYVLALTPQVSRRLRRQRRVRSGSSNRTIEQPWDRHSLWRFSGLQFSASSRSHSEWQPTGCFLPVGCHWASVVHLDVLCARRISWSAACRPWSLSRVWPSPFTTLAF